MCYPQILTLALERLSSCLRKPSATLKLLFASCLCQYSLAEADIHAIKNIDISSQDLTSSLIDLGKQTGISLIITVDDTTKAKITPKVLGDMTAIEAITKILFESGLSYEIISPRIVSIFKPIDKPAIENVKKPGKLEHVNVLGYKLTGSNIRRQNIEDGLAPLDIISEREIERSGGETLADFIKFIPAVSGNSTSTSVSNGGDGTTKVTLRGLPANNTLVLINGQRVVFDGLAGDSVDLNTIAPAAIDRLEILKDGASAIYGSDAIAGVINIVMKEHFDGVRVAQYFGRSSRSDIDTQSTSILAGKVGQRHSGVVALSYYQQDGLFSRDRNISDSADNRDMGGADRRVSATPLTRLTYFGENTQIPGTDPEDDNALILNTDANGEPLPGTSPAHFRIATSEDLYDFRAQTSSISPSERFGLYATLTNALSDTFQLTSYALASHTDATITLASAPIYTTFSENPIVVSADNLYNPFEENIADVRRRVVELPPRTQTNESENYHFNGVIEYLSPGFEWSAGIYWNRASAKEKRTNLIDGTRLALALGPEDECLSSEIYDCVQVNIFGPPGSITQDQLAFVATDQQSTGSSKVFGANTGISGTLPAHQQDQILYAAGIDWRTEDARFRPDTLDRDNLIGSVFQTPTRGEREVIEAYGELLIPLIKNSFLIKRFDLEIAARYTKSSDYGDNIAPKIGLKYRPSDDLMFRSTISTGFRAPSIKELYTDGGRSFASISDPCTNEDNVEQLVGCEQQSDDSLNQFLTEYSGSSELQPEESTNFTLGLYVTPTSLPGLTFSADIFSIRQKNVIDANPQTVVDENARSGAFSELVNRDVNGNITLIKAPFINLAERHVEGVDFNSVFELKKPNLQLNLSASYLHKYISKLNTFTEEEDLAGTFSDAARSGSGSLPHWKVNVGWILKKPQSEWSYNMNYISPLDETFQANSKERHRSIGQWLIHNTQMLYSPKELKNLDIILGVDNIFDQAPPFSASAFNDNFDSRTYNLKGRFLYGKLIVNFE